MTATSEGVFEDLKLKNVANEKSSELKKNCSGTSRSGRVDLMTGGTKQTWCRPLYNCLNSCTPRWAESAFSCESSCPLLLPTLAESRPARDLLSLARLKVKQRPVASSVKNVWHPNLANYVLCFESKIFSSCHSSLSSTIFSSWSS